MTPSGTLTTLYSFEGADGEYRYAAFVQRTSTMLLVLRNNLRTAGNGGGGQAVVSGAR